MLKLKKFFILLQKKLKILEKISINNFCFQKIKKSGKKDKIFFRNLKNQKI